MPKHCLFNALAFHLLASNLSITRRGLRCIFGIHPPTYRRGQPLLIQVKLFLADYLPFQSDKNYGVAHLENVSV